MRSEEYIEMPIDEMKSVKARWKGYFYQARDNLNFLMTIEETKENFAEIKSLERSYSFFIDEIGKIVKIYSKLINKAEDCELEEKDFLDAMKKVKLIHNDLHIEFNKKLFKNLNLKYIEIKISVANVKL